MVTVEEEWEDEVVSDQDRDQVTGGDISSRLPTRPLPRPRPRPRNPVAGT